MGNRAQIIFEGNNFGVYMHWNGGRDSVGPLLEYCSLMNPYHATLQVETFLQVARNSFNVGEIMETPKRITSSTVVLEDNGTYVVNRSWQIIKRVKREGMKEQNSYDHDEMLLHIDQSQPKNLQLGKEYLLAKNVEAKDLRIGDKIFAFTLDSKPEICVVEGFGKHFTAEEIPYINKYPNQEWEGRISINPNNYLKNKTYKTLSTI